MKALLRIALAVPLLLGACAVSALAQPRLQNARLEQRAVSGSLNATVQGIVNAQSAPVWITYAAPMIPGDRQMCCWNTTNNITCQGCTLEPTPEGQLRPGFPAAPNVARLEGATEFYIFLRAEGKRIERVSHYSIDCNIDAGGLPVYVLTGVNGADSVAFLESLVPAQISAPPASIEGREQQRVINGAISAIGLHRDEAADAALDRLSAAGRPDSIRRQATNSLGYARGRRGFEALVRILRDDPSDSIRQSAVNSLANSKESEAIPTLVRVARDDKAHQVRGRALMLLAERAARSISEDAIRNAVDRDPETAVKRQAVQALTRIPNGDGVPLLIEIARTNKNEAVRKEAMNLLGRTKDSRALKFFEDVLSK
jgi:hypothetical protein